MKVIFLISLFLLCFAANAKDKKFINPITLDCSGETRLDKGYDSPFENIPVYDQDTIGNCYAYSASVVLDYWRIKNEMSSTDNYPLSSPSQLALVYKMLAKEGESLDSGDARQTLDKVLKDGVCTQHSTKKAILDICFPPKFLDSDVHTDDDIPESTYIYYFEKLYAAGLAEAQVKILKYLIGKFGINWMNKKIKATISDKEKIGKFMKIYEDFYNKIQPTHDPIGKTCKDPALDTDVRIKDPNLLFSLFQASVMGKGKKGFTTFIRKILAAECTSANKVYFKKPKYKTVRLKDDKDILKRVKKAIVTGKKPVSISYCSNVLKRTRADNLLKPGVYYDSNGYRRSYQDKKSSASKKKAKSFDKCGAHESVIVGVRKNPKTKRCQFLIRNSWGKGCNWYFNSVSSYSDRQKLRSDNCESDKGSVWVDDDVLDSNIYDAFYIE